MGKREERGKGHGSVSPTPPGARTREIRRRQRQPAGAITAVMVSRGTHPERVACPEPGCRWPKDTPHLHLSDGQVAVPIAGEMEARWDWMRRQLPKMAETGNDQDPVLGGPPPVPERFRSTSRPRIVRQ